MQENVFPEPSWSDAPLGELLGSKKVGSLITTHVNDRMTDVISLLKQHDVSQVPVLDADGLLAGLLAEVDLLKHMLTMGHGHSPHETIRKIVRPAEMLLPISAHLEAALPALDDDMVMLATDEDEPVGILTKIDILDFIARESGRL